METKTTLDAVDILQNHIKNSVLFTDPNKPNGLLNKGNRLQNSRKEDVVLNILGLTTETIQEGVINLNLFVPNLELPTDPVDKSQANWTRLKYLGNLATRALEGITYGDGYNFALQQMIGPLEDTGNQHYLNFRIEFISINTI